MESVYKLLCKLLSLPDNEKNSNKEKIFQHFYKTVYELPRDKQDKFFASVKSEDTNGHENFVKVKEYFKWFPLDPAIKNKYKKNDDFSTAFRDLGNTAFHNKRYLDAVKAYNVAIVFANVPGKENPGTQLALAYANRSAAFNGIGLTEEALKDIDLALSTSENNSNIFPVQIKWKERKNKFEVQIKERLNNPKFEEELKREISKRNTFYEGMFTLKSPNPLAPALEDSVDIKWTSARGRHVVANRDIPLGATILVERPFAAILTKFLVWDVDHCHHCLKRNLRCIPCHKCVFTMYCNENCQKEAQEYHQYECPCLPELHCIPNDVQGNLYYLLLAFKLICLMGPQKLFKIFSQRNKQNRLPKEEPRSNQNIAGSDLLTRIYSPNSYDAIYNLMTTETPKDDYDSILFSLMFSHILQSSTTFFDSIKSSSEKLEFQDFISNLIHHHFETFPRNVYGIGGISTMDGITLRTYMQYPEPKKTTNYNTEASAMGIFATITMINHACDANVTRFYGRRFGTVAVVAQKPLKKGQELLISYSHAYGSQAEQDSTAKGRQVALNKVYKFQCDCMACKYDWPRVAELRLRQPEFHCPSCAMKFYHERKMSLEYQKCKLSGDFKCKSCGIQHSAISILDEYERNCRALESCQKLILGNYPMDSISTVKSALKFLETIVCPPNYFCLSGSNLFNRAVHLTIFFCESDL